MKKKATIAALLAVIATCFALIIRNVSAGMDDGYVPGWQREMIKRFDKDGDGTLNKAEKEAAQVAAQAAAKAGEERRKGIIREFDKDGDGKLDEGEQKAAAEVWAAREKTRIQKFDKDGDGKLSREEREAAGGFRNR